jgi:hypothetical protein
VRVVEAAAVDADDHLRARRLERLPLQPLDRLAADFAVEVAGTGSGFEAGERRLVRRPSRADDQPAAAGGPGRAERDRLRRPADDDPRRDAALKLDLVVEEQRTLRVGFGRRVADELQRLAGEVEQELTAFVLEDRPQLDQIRDEPAQTCAGRQPSVGERHGHARPLVRDPERAAERRRGRRVEHVRVDVGLVAAGHQEPRLDPAAAAHALDAPTALGEPDVAQPASKQTALALALGHDPECAEALVDEFGVDPLAVVQADELVGPAP